MEIAQQLNGNKLPILICSSGEVPAKIFQSLVSGEGLPVQGLLSLGSSYDAYALKNLDILSGRMLKELCLAEADGTLPTSLLLFPKVGILYGGKFSTPKISVSLKTESVSLSSVLEKEVPKKYFLSEKIQKRLTLWGQQSEQKTLESENETLFTDRGGVLGSLKATDYKQPPQILHRFDQYNKKYADPNIAGTLRAGGDTANLIVLNKGESQHYRLYDTDGLAPTLQSQSGMSSQKHPFIVAQRGRNPKNPKSRKSGLPTEQMLEPNLTGNSNTLTGVEKDNYVFDGQVRKLMPIECERLMSWQDDWTKWGIDDKGNKIEISDSQRYKMCGNGVVSNVVREIVKALL